jgi:hypothetical protein
MARHERSELAAESGLAATLERTMTQWNKRRLQAVQFEWEEEPQPRAVRLVSKSAQVGDPVRVTVAGVEVEGRIEAVESSTLYVRIGRRLF